MKQNTKNQTTLGLFRYMGVIIYDILLLLSVLFIATSIAVAINALLTDHDTIEPGNPFFFIYLLFNSFLFYGWFWTHGGQTLGMRSWKVYLISESGNSVTWQQALIRFCSALISWLPLAIGFWSLYLRNDKKSWHDRLSSTRLIVQKPIKKPNNLI